MSTVVAPPRAPAPATAGRPRRRRFPWWTLLGLVAAAALVVGSGVLGSSPPTPAQRAAAIEADLRCPSCEDLSVAQSAAPTAVAVRAAIRHQLAQGRSDQQIESYLSSRYGSSIELDPPASGWSLLVWLLPLVVALGGLVVLVAFLVRRQRATRRELEDAGAAGVDVVDASTGATPPAEDLDRRDERRSFLLRSLADADAEYLAGDLSDRDYLALRRRDLRRLADLDARPRAATAPPVAPSDADAVSATVPVAVTTLEGAATTAVAPGGQPAEADAPASEEVRSRAARRPRRGRSWWYLAGAVVAFAAALVVAVSQLSSDRQPGQTPTGGASLTPAQQTQQALAEAVTDEDEGKVAQAAGLYAGILRSQPNNEVALAQLGWIEFETGHPTGDRSLLSDARAKLERAVQLDPQDYAARLYLGTLLYEQAGDATAALAQFARFLADDPPAPLLSQAASVIRSAYAAAGQPAPPGVPAPG